MNNMEFTVPLCWILRVPIFEQGKPINLKQGKEITVTTDCMIRWQEHVLYELQKVGYGYKTKYWSLPGVIIGLPTLSEKDKIDILEWAVPNGIDIIALSFVRKGSDLVEVQKVLGKHAKNIMLMSQAAPIGVPGMWLHKALDFQGPLNFNNLYLVLHIERMFTKLTMLS